MVREEYLKKLERTYVRYWQSVVREEPSKVMELVKEIAKHTDDRRKVTRIVNGLWRGDIYTIEKLMKADINEIAKLRNIGSDALNILRQIKGLPTTTYADEHPFSKKKTRDKIIEQLEKLGYAYSTKLYDDGTVMTHIFICPDCASYGRYWEMTIEDHTEEVGDWLIYGRYWEITIEDHTEEVGDWLIYVSYHDPDQKDWDGHQIDISGCVEFEAMKLIVEFTEILKKGGNDR